MTQAARLLAFIRANPDCTTMDIQLGMRPFLANPRARISDLRAVGVDIVCVRRSDGRQGYRIRETEQMGMAL